MGAGDSGKPAGQVPGVRLVRQAGLITGLHISGLHILEIVCSCARLCGTVMPVLNLCCGFQKGAQQSSTTSPLGFLQKPLLRADCPSSQT